VSCLRCRILLLLSFCEIHRLQMVSHQHGYAFMTLSISSASVLPPALTQVARQRARSRAFSARNAQSEFGSWIRFTKTPPGSRWEPRSKCSDHDIDRDFNTFINYSNSRRVEFSFTLDGMSINILDSIVLYLVLADGPSIMNLGRKYWITLGAISQN
jgi:hypothetical protein